MRLGKWTLAIVAIALIFGGTAMAQSLDGNRLAIYNGSDYYTGDDHTFANYSYGKYYPSYAHWSGSHDPNNPGTFPWQIRGWIWAGMQAVQFGPTWVWKTVLASSLDNPYSNFMTWPYPHNYCTGIASHTTTPNPSPVYGSNIPSSMPSSIAGLVMVYPSSYGGTDAYLNIFATGTATWSVPSTSPWYGWLFAFTTTAPTFIGVPSGNSIYQYTYENFGPNGQYCLLSGNEMDCTGTGGGFKAISHAIGHPQNGYYFYWLNDCTGADVTWAQSLLVNDATCIPVNVPGTAFGSNPFAGYGFDVGTATLTPYVSTNLCFLKIMYEDVFNPGTNRALIAAFAHSTPSTNPYGPAGYRVAHAWDVFTNFFAGLWFVWQNQPAGGGLQPGYPAAVWGTTVAGTSVGVPIPANASLLCLELKFSGYSQNGRAPTASYQVCMF